MQNSSVYAVSEAKSSVCAVLVQEDLFAKLHGKIERMVLSRVAVAPSNLHTLSAQVPQTNQNMEFGTESPIYLLVGQLDK